MAHALSWPVAIVVLCLVFRRHISSLLARLTHLSLKHGETSLEATSGAATEQSDKADLAKTGLLSAPIAEAAIDAPAGGATGLALVSATKEADAAARRGMIDFGKNIPSVQIREDLIHAHLERMRFELNTEETTEILIRNLAYSQAVTVAERLYRLIFGSQISLLKSLNVGPAQTDAEMMRFYQKARKRYPKFYGEYPYENWRDFLLSQGVLVFDPEKGVYGINQPGRDFLTWIASQGLPEVKNG